MIRYHDVHYTEVEVKCDDDNIKFVLAQCRKYVLLFTKSIVTYCKILRSQLVLKTKPACLVVDLGIC